MNSRLMKVHPGRYMLFEKNEMKKIDSAVHGLFIGGRVLNDNHVVVLVDNQLILVPVEKAGIV